MKLTIEERITALEQDNIVLRDKLELIHKLVKEQRDLTLEYTHQAAATGDSKGEFMHPEEVRYTYCCRPRFEKLEKQMEEIQKLVEDRSAKPVKAASHELFQ